MATHPQDSVLRDQPPEPFFWPLGYENDGSPRGYITSLAGPRTEARVTVSDGLEYDVVTVFQDHQRAIIRFTYPDRQNTLRTMSDIGGPSPNRLRGGYVVDTIDTAG